jgi:hypothetical protein
MDPKGRPWIYIVVQALTAGVFGLVPQRFAFNADMQTCLIWAGAFFGGAGFLAWQQSQR